MSAIILDGKAVARELEAKIKKKIEENHLRPSLAIVSCGDDPASQVYVTNKIKAANRCGITPLSYWPDSVEELFETINDLNRNPNVDGIIVQLPLPKDWEYAEDLASELVQYDKDVDGLSYSSQSGVAVRADNMFDGYVPCTAKGIMTLLDHYNIPIAGQHVVIVGRSKLVGKPLMHLMLKSDATVTVCHSKTKNLGEITKTADILVVAAGRPNLVTADMVKHGAVVVDVGINRVDGKLCGDVDFENVKEVASHITPVPGGIGPMTVASLMENTLSACPY